MLKKLKRKLFGWYSPEMDWKWNLWEFTSKFSDPVMGFFSWIKRSLQYAWVLRDDRDWDYQFILDLLKYKISRHRKLVVKNYIVASSPVQYAEMLHVEKLIEKYQDNEFCKEDFDAHDKKWGKMSMEFEDDSNGKSKLNFNRPNAQTEEEKEQESREYMNILEKSELEKQKCWDDIFDSMKAYMEGWWE